MNAVTVALLASDPVTEEGAVARLATHREVKLTPAEHAHRAEVLLVLITAVTGEILSTMEQTYRLSLPRELATVLVADEIKEHQLFSAVRYGLVSLLYRQETDFSQIVRAVVAARAGRVDVPDVALRYLLDQVKGMRHSEATRRMTGTSLAAREIKVLELLSEGRDTGEVASMLNYSERTVKSILHDVVTRFKLRNRTHAVASAIRSGLL